MDVQQLMLGIQLFRNALDAARQAIDLLPKESNHRANAEQALQDARTKADLAEAEVAQGLGYRLCTKHYPPGIMLSKGDGSWECPECGSRDGRSGRSGQLRVPARG